jgi:hypothetical protein
MLFFYQFIEGNYRFNDIIYLSPGVLTEALQSGYMSLLKRD